MISVKELKVILKENKIHFYAYWNKKRLLALVNEHDLLPKKTLEKETLEKEKISNPKYERLKTIMHNPRKVSLEDVETSKIKTSPSIHKAAKFIDQAPMTVNYWGRREGVRKNKYKVMIQ